MKEIIIACILFLISIGAFVLSIRFFKEKGFLFNNAYIYASKQERENMDKTPYYRQSAIVFLLLGIVFLLNGLSALFHLPWVLYVIIVIAVIAITYAIVSSIRIETKKKHIDRGKET